MPESPLYTVAITANEIPNAQGWLVELLCADHRAKNPEVSARTIAKAAFRKTRGTEPVINRADATKYSSPRPLSFGPGNAQYTEACGCRAWVL